jgi:DNA-binding beta-propeller fold protein YncE
VTHVIRVWRTSRAVRLFVLIMLLGAASRLVLSEDHGRQTKVFGSDRLVSIEPLPEVDGQICESPTPAAANLMAAATAPESLRRLVQQESRPNTAALTPGVPRPSDTARAEIARRQPASTIKDPRDAFAGLFVDPVRNEVVIAEENNSSILVYDRMTNTPPGAALSEPKRKIHGEHAFVEYSCSVYVDPATGDIYNINNDTQNWVAVFDRKALGDAIPVRKFATPHTTFGVVADEETQELLITIQDDHAVLTFKKTAKDQDAPVRLLQGPKTLMADPHGIALDPKSGLIYVTNWGSNNDRRYEGSRTPRAAGRPNWPVGRDNNFPGSGKFQPPSITVYRKDAQGNVAPLRVIQGPKTLLNWPTSIAVHPDRGELFVANDTSDNITVYRSDANGDVAPIRVLKGPKTLIKNPTGIALDLANKELWVASFGSHSATVFPVDASGDVAPKRVIRSGRLTESSPMLGNPHTVAYDSKRDEILVAN